ncbi:hypothetical protein PR048_021915 [Dryococelus australis]|uniref:Uncharacterized protein n=1 Tax=Dryococelus australis TaxID=614101 RepID=A0ABQ9GZL7_9NEOP|nr:hypothetical protein PR048_021915 [Dryococelus australis]
MLVTGGSKQVPEVQTAILLTIVGKEGLEILNLFNLSDAGKKEPQKILQALEMYCIPRTNVRVEQHIFFTREQKKVNL